MELAIYNQTDRGQRREINEDCHGISTDRKLVVVCDGMGGHNAGEVASRTAVDTILESFQMLSQDEIEQICPDFKPAPQFKNARRLIAAIRLANHRIYSMSGQNMNQMGMGTTVVAIFLEKNYLIAAHAGDSRLYRFRDNDLQQLTTDHTWIGEFLGEDENNIDGLQDFGKSNVITRAVGIDPTIKIDLLIDAFQPGDRYLLCTDGLTGPVPDADIVQILDKYNADRDAVEQLIMLANDRGGPDNITAVMITVVRVEKEATPIERTQTTIKEDIEPAQQDKTKIVDDISKKLEETRIKTATTGRKKPKLVYILAAIFVVSALIVLSLMVLPRKDQELKNKPIEDQYDNLADSTQLPEEIPDTSIKESATGGTIKFFAIERDHADIFVDNKHYKLGDLNMYQLQVPAGAHFVEVHLDGFKIKKRVRVRTGSEVLIDIENELEKLKGAK